MHIIEVGYWYTINTVLNIKKWLYLTEQNDNINRQLLCTV